MPAALIRDISRLKERFTPYWMSLSFTCWNCVQPSTILAFREDFCASPPHATKV